jgi:hypothetical protein
LKYDSSQCGTKTQTSAILITFQRSERHNGLQCAEDGALSKVRIDRRQSGRPDRQQFLPLAVPAVRDGENNMMVTQTIMTTTPVPLRHMHHLQPLKMNMPALFKVIPKLMPKLWIHLLFFPSNLLSDARGSSKANPTAGP